ncbi:EF-hand domain-containing protein [Sagittula stellata]|nr:EF-hand domain-containing protein [Sagittula stellata]
MMTRTKPTLWMTAALVAVLTTAGAAQARDFGRGHDGAHGGPQGGMGPRGFFSEEMFAAADTDGDGKITEAEMKAAAEKRFTDADTNGDGMLSADEMAARAEAQREARRVARMTERSQAMIDRLDYDGDGMLSLEEAQRQAPADMFDRMLERLDTDGDGALSQEEIAAAKAKMRERHADRGHGPRGERGEGRFPWRQDR